MLPMGSLFVKSSFSMTAKISSKELNSSREEVNLSEISGV
jgi:hypothetical protein